MIVFLQPLVIRPHFPPVSAVSNRAWTRGYSKSGVSVREWVDCCRLVVVLIVRYSRCNAKSLIHRERSRRRLTALRTLDVSRNKINDLKNISELRELKSLNCDENSLVLGALVPISRLSKLQVLSLGKNRLDYPAGGGTFPTLPPKMKQLKLHGNSFSGKNRNIVSYIIVLELYHPINEPPAVSDT